MAVKVVDWLRQGRSFLQDVQSESKRVTWLNWKHTMAQTGVALLFIFAIALYLGLVDLGLSRLIHFLLRMGY